MTMKIGIDGNEANVEEKVGVHQYAYEILWGLYRRSKKEKKNKYLVYLKKEPLKDLPEKNSRWKYKVLPGKGLWILSRLTPHLLFKRGVDVFFAPHHYLPPVPGLPKVCFIHDLGYLEFSGQFRKYDFWQLKYWSAISIFISKCIICPSESTKKDIVRQYGFASDKVSVVPHGYDRKRFNQNISDDVVRRIKKKYKITKDYLLFISLLKPSKNVERLLDAFKEIRKDFDVQLMIAGKKGWLYEEIFEKVKHLGLTKSVFMPGFIPEEDKPALIKGAKAFVLPSFWEGFGMDVVNAISCGTPVVVSEVASLPEVAGGAGVYVDPYNKDSIATGIEKVLKMSKEEYNTLASKGLKQARKFSWRKTAKKTSELLRKAGE